MSVELVAELLEIEPAEVVVGVGDELVLEAVFDDLLEQVFGRCAIAELGGGASLVVESPHLRLGGSLGRGDEWEGQSTERHQAHQEQATAVLTGGKVIALGCRPGHESCLLWEHGAGP